MRLTVLYPSARQDAADLLKPALTPVTGLELTWVSTAADSFTADLAEICEDANPVVVMLDQALLSEIKGIARTIWGPVLRRIEAGAGSTVGLIRLDAVMLPPLIQKLRIAQKYECRREALRWVMSWLHVQPPSLPRPTEEHSISLEEILHDIVDMPGQLLLPVAGRQAQRQVARSLAQQLWPYFEYVDILEAPHESPVLRDAELGRMRTEGRGLTILTGTSPATRPQRGSLLVLHGKAIPEQPLNSIQLAAQWLPGIPSGTEGELPFATWELELVLLDLFSSNWLLANKLARRTGSYLRDNHRIAEAIWLYEHFLEQATGQRDTAAAQTCENELYWLRAGGARKQQFLAAGQSAFEF